MDDFRVAQAVAETLVEQARLGAAERALAHANIPGGDLVVAAYLGLWVFVFGLIFVTLRRQRRADAEVAALSKRMDRVFEGIERSH